MVLPVTIEALFGSRTARIVDDAITADEADTLRAKLVGWRRYALLDRGSYDFIDDVEVPSRFGAREARALRFVPGDYSFAHHDRIYDDLPHELVLDLSPAPCNADIHYRRRGAVFFRVPCVPRSLSIVERGPAVTRNFVYLSKLQPAEVIRIVMIAKDAP